MSWILSYVAYPSDDSGDSDDSDDSDDSNESDEDNPHQVRIRIMDLVRKYAGSDSEENTVDRVDNPADWSSCSDHDSDHDVLDIENDTDLDEYVLDRWGLYREKEPERDINYYNHNHRWGWACSDGVCDS